MSGSNHQKVVVGIPIAEVTFVYKLHKFKNLTAFKSRREPGGFSNFAAGSDKYKRFKKLGRSGFENIPNRNTPFFNPSIEQGCAIRSSINCSDFQFITSFSGTGIAVVFTGLNVFEMGEDFYFRLFGDMLPYLKECHYGGNYGSIEANKISSVHSNQCLELEILLANLSQGGSILKDERLPPGVAPDFAPFQRTGGGRSAQETPNITFSENEAAA